MPDAIWLISDLTPDGTYSPTLHINDDRAVSLYPPGKAVDYAMSLLTAIACAEYDAAVYAQMRHAGLSEADAVRFVAELRAERPPVPSESTAPLRFEPIVSGTSKKPLVHIYLDDKPLAQWTPDLARRHAVGVLELVAAVELDGAYYQHLRAVSNVGDDQARGIVATLNVHREEGGGDG